MYIKFITYVAMITLKSERLPEQVYIPINNKHATDNIAVGPLRSG